MHFFSRYSYIWRFPDDQEKAYARFVGSANLVYLRLVSFITIFGMTIFLVIDFFKFADFSTLLVARSAALLVAVVTMKMSFKKELTVHVIFGCVAVLLFTNLGVSLTTATYANMPPYYLTNLLFLLFVLVMTASGLNFRHALVLNAACLGVFLFYSQVINRNPFYFSQYPHLFSIFIYILIVGIVLENRRRLKFLNFEELEEQKRMVENLNQQKNKIISILSHDIAAPLNSLSGLLNLQTKGLVKPDQIAPYISQVGGQIENVHLLLQSLVRWSKSQIEGFVPDKKTLNVTEVIKQTCKQFATHAKEKSLEVMVHPEEAMYCIADEDMITVAFRNIVYNAIKFSKPNTSVEIKISKSSQNLIIQFSNQGDPIPEEQKEKLFTYQVHSTTGTAGEKGSGLGLAMSAYFVHLNDGIIYLDESVKERIVFCVELPGIKL